MAEILGRKVDPQSLEDIQAAVELFSRRSNKIYSFPIPRQFILPALGTTAYKQFAEVTHSKEVVGTFHDLLLDDHATSPITLSIDRLIYYHLRRHDKTPSSRAIYAAARQQDAAFNVDNVNKISMGVIPVGEQEFAPRALINWLQTATNSAIQDQIGLLEVAWTPLNGPVSSPWMHKPKLALLHALQESVSVIHAGPLQVQSTTNNR